MILSRMSAPVPDLPECLWYMGDVDIDTDSLGNYVYFNNNRGSTTDGSFIERLSCFNAYRGGVFGPNYGYASRVKDYDLNEDIQKDYTAFGTRTFRYIVTNTSYINIVNPFYITKKRISWSEGRVILSWNSYISTNSDVPKDAYLFYDGKINNASPLPDNTLKLSFNGYEKYIMPKTLVSINMRDLMLVSRLRLEIDNTVEIRSVSGHPGCLNDQTGIHGSAFVQNYFIMFDIKQPFKCLWIVAHDHNAYVNDVDVFTDGYTSNTPKRTISPARYETYMPGINIGGSDTEGAKPAFVSKVYPTFGGLNKMRVYCFKVKEEALSNYNAPIYFGRQADANLGQYSQGMIVSAIAVSSYMPETYEDFEECISKWKLLDVYLYKDDRFPYEKQIELIK